MARRAVDRNTVREILVPATWFGIELLPLVNNGGWWQPNGLLLLPPSAFFIIGLIIWACAKRIPSRWRRRIKVWNTISVC